MLRFYAEQCHDELLEHLCRCGCVPDEPARMQDVFDEVYQIVARRIAEAAIQARAEERQRCLARLGRPSKC